MEVSPTGKPVIDPKYIPLLAIAIPIALGLVQLIPANTIAYKVCMVVVSAIGSLVGVASPGLRTKPPELTTAQDALKVMQEKQ